LHFKWESAVHNIHDCRNGIIKEYKVGKIKFLIVLCVCLVQLFSSCRSAEIAGPRIEGIAADENGEALCGASIFLDEECICITDMYGHFSINRTLPEGSTIRCEKESYVSAECIMEGSGKYKVIYFNLKSAEGLFAQALKSVKEEDYKKALSIISELKTGLIKPEEFVSSLYLEAVVYLKLHEEDNFFNVIEDLKKHEADYECIEQLVNDFGRKK